MNMYGSSKTGNRECHYNPLTNRRICKKSKKNNLLPLLMMALVPRAGPPGLLADGLPCTDGAQCLSGLYPLSILSCLFLSLADFCVLAAILAEPTCALVAASSFCFPNFSKRHRVITAQGFLFYLFLSTFSDAFYDGPKGPVWVLTDPAQPGKPK